MKITKSQLERIIKEELEEELVERDSMRTQVDTGPTQAIEDDDPTQVEPDTDNDKKYGLTQIIDDENPFDPEATVGVEASQELDTAPTQVEGDTRVDLNTLGARVGARQQYRRNRSFGYDIKRTPWATRKRTQVSPGRDQEKRREVGRIMNKYPNLKKESITKNELLRLIREELEEALEATRSEKTRSYASPTEKTRADGDKTRSEYTRPKRIDISKLKLPGPSTHPDKSKTRSYASPTEKTRSPKTRVMEATKSNLQELIREELAKLK